MVDFQAVLREASQLPIADRMRLIDALWQLIPDELPLALNPAWEFEINRRAASLDAGTTELIPWEKIRDEAQARIHDGHSN